MGFHCCLYGQSKPVTSLQLHFNNNRFLFHFLLGKTYINFVIKINSRNFTKIFATIFKIILSVMTPTGHFLTHPWTAPSQGVMLHAVPGYTSGNVWMNISIFQLIYRHKIDITLIHQSMSTTIIIMQSSDFFFLIDSFLSYLFSFIRNSNHLFSFCILLVW